MRIDATRVNNPYNHQNNNNRDAASWTKKSLKQLRNFGMLGWPKKLNRYYYLPCSHCCLRVT